MLWLNWAHFMKCSDFCTHVNQMIVFIMIHARYKVHKVLIFQRLSFCCCSKQLESFYFELFLFLSINMIYCAINDFSFLVTVCLLEIYLVNACFKTFWRKFLRKKWKKRQKIFIWDIHTCSQTIYLKVYFCQHHLKKKLNRPRLARYVEYDHKLLFWLEFIIKTIKNKNIIIYSLGPMIAVNSLERNRPLIFFKISFSSRIEKKTKNT